jgi:hypothetical protein
LSSLLANPHTCWKDLTLLQNGKLTACVEMQALITY